MRVHIAPKRPFPEWRFLQLTIVIVAWMLLAPHLQPVAGRDPTLLDLLEDRVSLVDFLERRADVLRVHADRTVLPLVEPVAARD